MAITVNDASSNTMINYTLFFMFPFPGIFCQQNQMNERETSCKRTIEKRSLVPRMIYLSIQSASASMKENVEANGAVPLKVSSELKLLLERYTQLLGFSLQEAVDVIMDASRERSSEVWLFIILYY